jgi:hypothetical protein
MISYSLVTSSLLRRPKTEQAIHGSGKGIERKVSLTMSLPAHVNLNMTCQLMRLHKAFDLGSLWMIVTRTSTFE